MNLTRQESDAIDDLRNLSHRWPDSLKLFAWSGTLHVLKPGDGRTYEQANLETFPIPCDGGDPNRNDVA